MRVVFIFLLLLFFRKSGTLTIIGFDKPCVGSVVGHRYSTYSTLTLLSISMGRGSTVCVDCASLARLIRLSLERDTTIKTYSYSCFRHPPQRPGVGDSAQQQLKAEFVAFNKSIGLQSLAIFRRQYRNLGKLPQEFSKSLSFIHCARLRVSMDNRA